MKPIASWYMCTAVPSCLRLLALVERSAANLTRGAISVSAALTASVSVFALTATRTVVPSALTVPSLKAGYDRAYRHFYRWSSIARAARSHESVKHQIKHFFYAAGWKKFEPLWDMVIRAQRLAIMTPLLEGVLSRVTSMSTPNCQDPTPNHAQLPTPNSQ